MITREKSSRSKQEIYRIIEKIKKLSYSCAYMDPLIKGCPGEVFRKCGKATCKCSTDDSRRHGPYMVIQTYQNGKQKQISLKKDQKDIWGRAKNYQKQIRNIAALKTCCLELEKLVKQIIEERVEKWP